MIKKIADNLKEFEIIITKELDNIKEMIKRDKFLEAELFKLEI